MGIIPFFLIRAKLPPFFLWKNLLKKNQDRSRIKVFDSFENTSKPSSIINAILISYGYVYKRSINPLIKSSRFNHLKKREQDIKNYWRIDGKTYRFNSKKNIDYLLMFL